MKLIAVSKFVVFGLNILFENDRRIKIMNWINNFNMYKHTPKDATIAVTYKCNSRCRMCNIWQMDNPGDLPLGYFYNLSKHLKYINLSGGETFLRSDLPDIVKIIKKASPRAQIIISSNGLATDLISRQAKAILEIDKNIGIRISLDGIGEVHDQIRGIAGIYEQALKTVKSLKDLGIKNLGLSFTIMDINAGQIKPVYDLSRKMNLELALALVQNSDVYFQKADNKIKGIDAVADGLNYIISQELKSFKIKRWFRAYYDYGLWYYAKHKKRLLKSGAGCDSLFIDPSGDIYPSNLINLKMGNLRDGRLDEIWNAPLAGKARQEIKDKNIQESWIICTVRGEMKKHLLKIGYWILKRKFISKINSN